MKVNDSVRKALLFGLGVGLMTKSQVEKAVSKVKSEYDLNEKDARKVVNSFITEAKKHEKALEKKFKTEVKKAYPKKKTAAKKKASKKKPSKKKTTKKSTTKKKTSKKKK